MIAKSLRDLAARHPEKIATIYRDPDGLWLDLKLGWQIAPHTRCHSIHESTARDIVAAFREVCPCDCRECRTGGAEWEDLDIDTGQMRIYRRGE